MIPEAPLRDTETGLVPSGEGWFVLNAQEARWFHANGRGARLLFEGEERQLRQWDFVHCPPETNHNIVGAGERPCAVLAVGARQHQTPEEWGGYTVDETALRHGAGVEQETTEAKEAYAALPTRGPTCYREGWLTANH